MAIGYLVTLGDGNLDAGDSISGSQSTFTIDREVGNGSWTWSGVSEADGQTYTNQSDTGVYYQALDGNVYFIPNTTMITSGSAAATTVPAPDGTIDGTAGNDTIDSGYNDPEGDQVTSGNNNINAGSGDDTVTTGSGNDTIDLGSGNDSVTAGDGADSVVGHSGDDSISGGGGDDLLVGDITGSNAVYFNTSNGELLQYNSVTGGTETVMTGLHAYGDIAMDPSNGDLYGITFSGGSTTPNSGIYIIDPEAGTQTLVYDIPNDADAYASLTFSPDGNLYFSQNGTGALSVMTPDGSGGFNAPVSAGSVLADVKDMVFLDSDTVWTTANGVIYQYDVDASGNFINEANLGTVNGQTDIWGLSLGDDGRIYATEGTGEVHSTDPSGSPLSWTQESQVELSGNQVWGATSIDFDLSNAGTDTIDGGDGDDRIYGGGNDDSLMGGTGDDTLFGGTGADSMDGGAGNDTLTGGSGDDTLDGGAGDDTLTGGAGSDTMTGGADQDAFYGGGGDVIDGSETGVDNDTLYVSEVDYIDYDDANNENGVVYFNDGSNLTFSNIENVVVSERDGTVSGTAGDDNINAAYVDGNDGDTTDGSDAIIAGHEPNDDLIEAGAGNDTVDGSAGSDTIYGGTGNDLVYSGSDASNDTVFGEAGNDTMFGFDGDDELYGGADNDIVDGDEGNDSLYGGTGDDQLIGDGGTDTMYGGDGADTFYAGADDDTVYGGAGDDLAYGGAGNDTFETWIGNDTVYGGDGDDYIDGAQGNDELHGGDGNDNVLAGSDDGDDTLYGGTGDDTLSAGEGEDTLYGGTGADTQYGAGGDDIFVLENSFGNDTITGGETDETIGDTLDATDVTADVTVDLSTLQAGNPEMGTITDGTSTATFEEIENINLGSGDDSVIGSSGDENVSLGSGADTFDGGAGDDTVDLGSDGSGNPDGDADVVILQDGFGNDVVANFDAPTPNGDGTFTGVDTLDVSDLTDGIDPVNTNDVTVSDDGSGNAVLTFPNGESIVLEGIDPADADDPFYLNALGIPLADGTVSGTGGDDTIDAAYTGDPDGDMVDNGDAIIAGDVGDDDLIEAGGGSDTVFAGAGNDEVYGDNNVSGTLDWSDASLTNGDGIVAANGNGDTVNVTVTGEGVVRDSIYNSGDYYAPSTVQSEDPISTLLEFDGPVSNVTFELYDVDSNESTFDDQYTIIALDAAGNQVPVTFSDLTHHTVNGNTVEGNDELDQGGTGSQDAITVTIPDEVVSIEIIYEPGSYTPTDGTPNTGLSGIGDLTFDIVSTAGDDELYGGAGDDTLYGEEGTDALDGGTGNDTLYGGADNDTLTGGDGNDLIIDNNDTTSADTIYGGAGEDTVFVDGQDTVYGGTDDDTVNFNYGVGGVAYGEEGDDTLTGGNGNQSLYGGSGNDTITGSSNNEFGTTDSDVLDGGDGDDIISSGQTAAPANAGWQQNGDTLIGGAGNDTMTGGSANDTLYGGTGDDSMSGGDGADTFIIEDGFGTDTIEGGEGTSPGDNTDTIDLSALNSGIDATFTGDESGNVVDGTNTIDFIEIERVDATDYDDNLDASATTNGITLSGNDGDDTLTGGSGDDVLDGGDGDDTFVLNDTFGDDTITGGETGETNGDTLDATNITADVTVDLSTLEPGNPEAGTITDGTSTTTFDEIENIELGAGDDSVIGSSSDDNVSLGAGSDTFDGGAGDDTVDLGSDGTGNPDGDPDVVILQDGFGNDVVSNFDAPTPNGDGTFTGIDTLDVTNLTDGTDPVNTNDVTVTDDGFGNAVLTFPNGESIVLEGIDPADADDPLYLNAIGIPMGSDGTVEGTAGADVIDISYTGDPDGDRVDNNDAVLPGDTGDDDLIEAGGGNDNIFAGAGNDEVYGGTDNDTVNAGSGDDTVYGGTGDDLMFGFEGTDTIYGGDGDDIINGGVDADSLYGGDDDDQFVLEAGFGSDVIEGGEGGTDDDLIRYEQNVDATVTTTGDEAGTISDGTSTATFSEIEALSTGSGDDNIDLSGDSTGMTVSSNAGSDTIVGGSGDDVINSGADDDSIAGGVGSDTINAGSGDDTVTVAEGDSVDGGSGDDLFVLEDLGEPENGTITIDGGAGDETGGDTLNLGGLTNLTQAVIDTFVDDGTGSYSGSVTLNDGTILNFSEIENIICFTPHTRIATPQGLVAIEDLEVGDMVVTRDHGLQPIRWIEARAVPAVDRFAPVKIRKNVLAGQDRDLIVSPQHRVLFQGYRAELLFGESEVLVAAKHLVDGADVTQDESTMVTYMHILFDQHEIIYAEGAATESFHPGDIGFSAVGEEAREELFAIFPELRVDPRHYGATARRCLKKEEAKLIRT